MKKKVVIVDHREEGYEIERKALEHEDVVLYFYDCRNEDDLIERVRDAFIIAFTYSKFSRKTISQLDECKLLVRYGVGLDNVDLNAASEKGIFVCNAPDYGTFAVAEHTFSLLLSLTRKINLLHNSVIHNHWNIKNVAPVYSLINKTLGIVGFGNIGRQVSKFALAFNMKVIVYDPYIDENTAKEYGVEKTSFDKLISESDHITIHSPLNEKTRNLFNISVFDKMKKGSTLTNTARGEVVNQSDIIDALRSGKLSGACLDVFEKEPIEPTNELLKLENVILTPHIAWYTEESIMRLHEEVVDNIASVLKGNQPKNVANKSIK